MAKINMYGSLLVDEQNTDGTDGIDLGFKKSMDSWMEELCSINNMEYNSNIEYI